MIFVWFIYGLAFFALGLVIIVYPKKGSMFKLADCIWLIAGFGILHGINEWLDMFIVLKEPFPPAILKLIRIVILPCSFLFLLRFGTKIIADTRKGFRLLQAIPIILFTIWAIILAASTSRHLMGDICARYLLCAPGAFLTAVGLFLQIPQFRETKLHSATRNLRLAAITFLLYAVFAGLIVKKAGFFPASFLNYDLFRSMFGVPVQLFRALCAVVLAWSTTKLLVIFRWETQEKMDKYRREMEKNTRLAEVGTMGSTMSQQLDEPLAVTNLLLQRILADLGETSATDTVMSSLKKSLSEVSKATDIVNRFQSIAHVPGKVAAKPVDLYRIIKRILAVFAQSARHANLTIAVKDIDTVLNLPIPVRQLEQIFFILVQNAIDNANININKHQKLIISCHLSEEQVELRFSETGVEIEPESLPHIFEPFFIIAPGMKETGLGLAVAKQIVCSHGGEISVENQPGFGSTFHVTLPTK
jgi:signal transduction histidine kinase